MGYWHIVHDYLASCLCFTQASLTSVHTEGKQSDLFGYSRFLFVCCMIRQTDRRSALLFVVMLPTCKLCRWEGTQFEMRNKQDVPIRTLLPDRYMENCTLISGNEICRGELCTYILYLFNAEQNMPPKMIDEWGGRFKPPFDLSLPRGFETFFPFLLMGPVFRPTHLEGTG
ncbi:hypothetical protein V8F06_004295 [Rhypophila decipiens]